MDALRQERLRTHNPYASSSSDRDSPRAQPLHSMSLPHLTPSSAVQDMMGRQNASSSQSSFFAPQPISATHAGSDYNRSVSFLEPPTSDSKVNTLSSSPDPIRSGPPAPTSNSNSSSSSTPTVLPKSQMNPSASDLKADEMDVDAPERSTSEETRRKSAFDDLFTKHRGGTSITSETESFDGRRRPSLATTSGRGSAESSEQRSSTNGPIDA